MATYISLVKFTGQGIGNIKETVQRAERGKRLAESLGGRMTNVLWTQGPYDIVLTLDFPDDETLSAFLLATARQGHISTQTMRAFTAEEVQRIVEKIP